MRSLLAHPVILLAALIGLGLLVWGFWPAPVAVEAAHVTRAPLTVAIEEEGRTRVIDRYTIAAPVDGVTCRLGLDVGDPVKKGEVLLSIAPMASQVLDPRSRAQAEARVSAANAALHAAQEQASAAIAAADLADDDLVRLQKLAKRKLISQGELDQAITRQATSAAARRSAEFNVDVARYELDAAKSVLKYTGSKSADVDRVPVTSPIDGRVLAIAQKCEAPVRTGAPLLEVGDPRALEVEVDLLSADAVRINPGMLVYFERWGGDHPLTGVVRTVEPVGFTKVSALGVEEQRVLVISDFTSPAEEWRRLGDRYRVEARFILWHQDNVLQIPASSLFRYKDGWAVFVIKGNRALRRKVEIGERNGLAAQVTAGLEAGESVINHPGDNVDNGVAVRIED